MFNLGAFAGHLIVGHVLVDGTKIPYEQYQKLKPKIAELQGWASIFQDLEVSKPQSWVHTGERLISKISSNRKTEGLEERRSGFNIFEEALSEIRYSTLNKSWPLAPLVWDAVHRGQESFIYRDDDYVYTRIDLTDGQFILRKRHRPKLKDSEGPEEPSPYTSHLKVGDLYIPSGRDETKRRWFRAVGQVALKDKMGGTGLILDWNTDKDEFIIDDLVFPNRPYRGEALNFVDEWRVFIDKGIRRCICLQGPPGTGKSTLARTASRKLGMLTLQITAEAFENMTTTLWNSLLLVINPQVVILDDIDRIYHLQNYLDRFEDAYYKVPLTIFTSNDLDQVPDAMKRPGRIDQIIELDDPSPEVRLQVLREFAAREGAGDIPDWKIPFLHEIYEKYTGAYAVEYMRRISAFGWDYKIPKGDLTFPEMVGREEELDPRLNTDLEDDLLIAANQEVADEEVVDT